MTTKEMQACLSPQEIIMPFMDNFIPDVEEICTELGIIITERHKVRNLTYYRMIFPDTNAMFNLGVYCEIHRANPKETDISIIDASKN